MALLTSKSLDEILWYYPSSETSLEELLFAAIILFPTMLQIEIFHHHFFLHCPLLSRRVNFLKKIPLWLCDPTVLFSSFPAHYKEERKGDFILSPNP